jgi:hypothetical protein
MLDVCVVLFRVSLNLFVFQIRFTGQACLFKASELVGRVVSEIWCGGFEASWIQTSSYLFFVFVSEFPSGICQIAPPCNHFEGHCATLAMDTFFNVIRIFAG